MLDELTNYYDHMQCVVNRAVIPLPRPNTFAGLMELYESNYIKIKKLCYNFNELHEYSFSKVDKGMDLHLFVLERNKYTITLKLTYYFSNMPDSPQDYPNVIVRVYFDAMQAEVLRRVSRRPTDNNRLSRNLDKKWRDNRFLFKWLSFCLHQGHEFVPVSA